MKGEACDPRIHINGQRSGLRAKFDLSDRHFLSLDSGTQRTARRHTYATTADRPVMTDDLANAENGLFGAQTDTRYFRRLIGLPDVVQIVLFVSHSNPFRAIPGREALYR
jgi:hypothetical protein